MKALSIKQPWASLICTPREDNPALGIKDIENRTWKTKFRGKIYVHASAKWVAKPKETNTYGPIYTDQQWCNITETYPESLVSLLDNTYTGENDNLPLSAIIGEVDIIDCVINHESIWAEKTEGVTAGNQFFYKKPIWNWVLANPVLYEKPIPAKGKLSFWEPDFDIEECIWCSGKSDYEQMIQDDAGENYCPECWKEAEPILQADYEEAVRDGSIDQLEENGYSFETGV